MRRARNLLLGSLPFLAALPLAIATEVPPLPRVAEPARTSQGDSVEGSPVASPSPLTLQVGPVLEERSHPGADSNSGAPLEDCQIVEQWVETIHGVPHLCSKWQCKDGRTWTD